MRCLPSFLVNLGWSKGLGDWFFVLLGGYILFTIAGTISLIRRFSKKDRKA